MITTESIEEFNLKYDGANKGAPGLDLYEMSVYFTTAQEEMVKAYYSGNHPSEQGFENSERRRRALDELVLNYSQSTSTQSARGMVPESRFVAIPAKVWYIVSEQVTLSKPDDVCINGKSVLVKPITHDEFWISYNNPFRKPNHRKAWRLDISKSGSNNVVEIIASEEISSYDMRYIKEPEPIILTDLTQGDFEGLGLSINGKTAEQGCLLSSEIHREILNRAVELAVRDYRENSLKSQVETNNRV